VKLLRVLQDGSYYPVGSRNLEFIDVRLISATNRDLPLAVQQGEFREDLFYRIKGLMISTTGLETRGEDIPLLLRFFLNHYNNENKLALKIDPEVVRWFSQTSWPGNVRELKNTLESSAAICLTQRITMQELELIRSDHHHLDISQPYERSADELLQKTLEQQVNELEMQLIDAAMKVNHNNKTHSAQQLGITRQGLINKINRYELVF